MVKLESSRFKHKLKTPMAAYILDVLSCHQRNILFLLFACVIENYIGCFILQSNIPTLSRNCCILLHATVRVAYYLFIRSLQLLPNWKIQGSVWVSYSVLPTHDSFENISNEIPCVNIFLLFIPTINF